MQNVWQADILVTENGFQHFNQKGSIKKHLAHNISIIWLAYI